MGPLTAPVAGAALRLTMQENGTAVAEYSEEMDSTGAGIWRPVPRGMGWLHPGSLRQQVSNAAVWSSTIPELKSGPAVRYHTHMGGDLPCWQNSGLRGSRCQW